VEIDVKELRLGIIGMSPGNGHPYSWSAIFNGYDRVAMEECGFPAIPRYLERQRFPEDCIAGAQVTHIWTQDAQRSAHIARAARIDHVVEEPGLMVGQVDAVLLARDDAERHYELAKVFLDAGVPIYIDKPLALSVREAQRFFAEQRFPGQVYSCSALRFAREFQPEQAGLTGLGRLRYAAAIVPKDWDKYAVHVIDPLLHLGRPSGKLSKSQVFRTETVVTLSVAWSCGFQATISTLGNTAAPMALRLVGEQGWKDLVFSDTFFAFRGALLDFVQGVREGTQRIDPTETLAVIELVEAGRV
jgi:hypothetical protein